MEGRGLLFINEALTIPATINRDSNHNTIHLLAASVVSCDWDPSGSGREEELGWFVYTHVPPPHWEKHTANITGNKTKIHSQVY